VIHIALMHYPVYNKNKEIVTTCITGFDLHDIARTALTFGVSKYFVVNPAKAQQKFAKRILDCWKTEQSYLHNWTRAEAFALVELADSFDQVVERLGKPKIVVTSAKKVGSVGFETLRKIIEDSSSEATREARAKEDFLIVFGTGWGLADEIMDKADYVLEPIVGPVDYNHLSVRSAVAITLDRLFGRNKSSEATSEARA